MVLERKRGGAGEKRDGATAREKKEGVGKDREGEREIVHMMMWVHVANRYLRET